MKLMIFFKDRVAGAEGNRPDHPAPGPTCPLLAFEAERPPPHQIVQQELMMAAEERGEYF